LKVRSVQIYVNVADLIYAIDVATGERCGLLYGDPEIESLPRDPLSPWTWPVIMEFSVDLETDDMEHVVRAVWDIKCWCCYPIDGQGL
jgi:hypothetical protein